MAGADSWWNRADECRRNAKALQATGAVADSYHLAGQAIEFALKAIYLQRNQLTRMPAALQTARGHDLEHLASAALFSAELSGMRRRKDLHNNWLTVRDWSSNRRFPDSKKVAKRELLDLLTAGYHETNGVWIWLEKIYQNG